MRSDCSLRAKEVQLPLFTQGIIKWGKTWKGLATIKLPPAKKTPLNIAAIFAVPTKPKRSFGNCSQNNQDVNSGH